ncbi:hypothetical protein WAI453_007909 [Rhynchosporium graminicola]
MMGHRRLLKERRKAVVGYGARQANNRQCSVERTNKPDVEHSAYSAQCCNNNIPA